MCGLAGVIGDIYSTDVKVFKQLMHVTYLRGVHATGFVNVRGGSSDNTVFKRAYNPIDVFDMKKADAALSVNQSQALLGHCRQATVGASGKHENAHPFTFGDVTMMHNGTLTSRQGLQGTTADFPVDSAQIAYSLSELTEDDDIKEMLESLNGAFALVWSDARDGTINIARNDERTLYYAISKSGRFYYASEKAMLDLVLTRNSVDLEVEPTLFPVGVWFAIPQDPKDKEVHKVEFTPRPKRVSTISKTNGWSGRKSGGTSTSGNSVVSRTVSVPAAQQNVLKDMSLEVDNTITFIPTAVGSYPNTDKYVAVRGVLSQEPWCDVVIHGIPSQANIVKHANKESCFYYDAKIIGVANMSEYNNKDLATVELACYNPEQIASDNNVLELPKPEDTSKK
ncbi:nucleophile aminohydrolase [Vibrio phage 1.293.O._10N.261.52.E1]|nr:nucleophile aminohydrolase [Vibrio phage 1.293.O._10N.261.52.E1]